jgi:hypothetical protein
VRKPNEEQLIHMSCERQTHECYYARKQIAMPEVVDESAGAIAPEVSDHGDVDYQEESGKHQQISVTSVIEVACGDESESAFESLKKD